MFQAAANAVKRLIPLFDRVLIQRAEAITKTKGGIVLPEKAQAKVLRGTVIATGPGAKNDVCICENCTHFYISFKIFLSTIYYSKQYLLVTVYFCFFFFRKESMCL